MCPFIETLRRFFLNSKIKLEQLNNLKQEDIITEEEYVYITEVINNSTMKVN